MVESRELKIDGKIKKWICEYANQILEGDNIEPPISENQSRMQIITSFA